jgi:hypothetical protein
MSRRALHRSPHLAALTAVAALACAGPAAARPADTQPVPATTSSAAGQPSHATARTAAPAQDESSSAGLWIVLGASVAVAGAGAAVAGGRRHLAHRHVRTIH